MFGLFRGCGHLPFIGSCSGYVLQAALCSAFRCYPAALGLLKHLSTKTAALFPYTACFSLLAKIKVFTFFTLNLPTA